MHVSVLLNECIQALALRPDGLYVDATLGFGGHSEAIAKRLTSGHLFCFDQDEAAIEHSRTRLQPYQSSVTLIHANFRHMGVHLKEAAPQGVDGILFDLGVSSPQLDRAELGFSYHQDAPLDMRMDRGNAFTAKTLNNTADFGELQRILRDYGEERYADRIARQIINRRQLAPLETTGELVDCVKRAMPAKALRKPQHPAMRTFQAIRIAVNDELGALKDGLTVAIEALRPGGRIAVISFHSLEDRIAKTTFKQLEDVCTCPPDFPMCVCGNKPSVKVITRQPLVASQEECEENRRARSAKLRVAEKL